MSEHIERCPLEVAYGHGGPIRYCTGVSYAGPVPSNRGKGWCLEHLIEWGWMPTVNPGDKVSAPEYGIKEAVVVDADRGTRYYNQMRGVGGPLIEVRPVDRERHSFVDLNQIILGGCVMSGDETVDVGYVHVLNEPGGECVDTCPHPSHAGVHDLYDVADEFGVDLSDSEFVPWSDADRAADFGDLLEPPVHTVNCETVTVTVEGQSFTLPAFTRPHTDLIVTVKDHLTAYILASIEAGAGVSLADFTLFLITQAAREPREQEVPS